MARKRTTKHYIPQQTSHRVSGKGEKTLKNDEQINDTRMHTSPPQKREHINENAPRPHHTGMKDNRIQNDEE